MGNFSKTISYLKRNGIKSTCYEVAERLDKIHLEEIQKKAAVYKGKRYFCEEKAGLNKRRFQKDFVFSILVPAYETNPTHLKEMLDSVTAQSEFAKVELIVADASKSDKVEQVIKAYTGRLEDIKDIKETPAKLPDRKKEKKTAEKAEEIRKHPVIKYIRLKENKGISENTNAALALATGDYIGLLDHDDVLLSDALFHVRCKLEEGEYELLYSDEDKSDGEMAHFFEPHFKPDFNLDYLLSNNYICHFLVMKAGLMKKLGFRKEYDGAQDYDLVLRAAGELLLKEGGREKIAHIPKVLYHWRCHESSTASNPESKRYAYEAGKRAVEDFLRAYMNLGKEQARVCHTAHLGFYKVAYRSDMFQARKEVAAICGRVIQKGKVTEGPAWYMEEGKLSLFTGLRAGYGGYMHRAEMIMQVDEMPKQAVCWNKRYRKLFKKLETEGKRLSFREKQQIAREKGDIFLYVPDFRQRVKEIK